MIYVVAVISLVLTRFLADNSKIGTVLGSAIATLVLLILVEVISLSIDFNKLEYLKIIFTSSFIGMTTEAILSKKEVVSSPIVMILIYKYLPPIFDREIGGYLGFCAFLTIIVYVSLKRLTNSKLFS